jgi:phosphoglycolate phosphatase
VPVSIRLAVLEMEGTTVCDDGLLARAFEDALSEVGVGPDDPRRSSFLDVAHETRGRRPLDVFRSLFADESTARDAGACVDAIVGAQIAAGEFRPLPGAFDALSALHDDEVKICLTTGTSSENQQALLERLGWDDLVELALAAGVDSARGHPYPDMILSAVMRLRVDDVRAVAVVGATPDDLVSGWRSGASVVAGVLTGSHSSAELAGAPHTHILAGIAELPALLRDGRR